MFRVQIVLAEFQPHEKEIYSKIWSVKDMNLPVMPLVTRLQFTTRDSTAPSRSRKNRPDDKFLSCIHNKNKCLYLKVFLCKSKRMLLASANKSNCTPLHPRTSNYSSSARVFLCQMTSNTATLRLKISRTVNRRDIRLRRMRSFGLRKV
jgi:hypothetical protein